ncbi:hypothetical protein DSCW_35610 [Desulfosarcina widdelii]|uniref:Uncharacterized protein n=1 Tax=Desulfosarcina widdelii TaxID=947919 RepID=A0A5K7ZCF6_9BACT|nr:hypothetical protein [Desulfosarcina widdelii]BBO76144.1 hypothetical protein DSCW_35610 [Desulfosarcina widdelii]
MDKTDAERFRNLMLGMADNFRDSLSKEGMRLRFEMLRPYSIEQVERAGIEIMCSRKYNKMPPVAEFIEAIEGAALSLETKANHQWNTLMEQVRSVGWYGTPSIEDPITRKLMTGRFSMASLCEATPRELSFLRRDFLAAYLAEESMGEVKLITDGTNGKKVKKLAAGIFKNVS